jgi:hypothetical protein
MAGGEHQGINGMGKAMNESAGEGLPVVKVVGLLCCCMTNQGYAITGRHIGRYKSPSIVLCCVEKSMSL